MSRNKTLVLDVSMQFVGLRTARRGLSYVEANKGFSLLDSERTVRSSTQITPIPSIVVLYKPVAHLRPPRAAKTSAGWSRIGVLIRDNHVCAYCGEFGNTIDHIHPRGLGGGNTWGNTITACTDCNGKKGMRTLAESGMTLLFNPGPPLSPDQTEFLQENGMQYVVDRIMGV